MVWGERMEITGAVASGGDKKRGVFKWPPLPGPLLHKFVEEREKKRQTSV
jgi:hypothetical protein